MWDCVYHPLQVVVTPFTLDLEYLDDCSVRVVEEDARIHHEDMKEIRPGPEVLFELFGDDYACYLPGQTQSRGHGVACDDSDVCQEGLVCRTSLCLPLGTASDTCHAHEECEDGLYCSSSCLECSDPSCPERLPGCIEVWDQRSECLSCVEDELRNNFCAAEVYQLGQCADGCRGHPDYIQCFQDRCGHLSNNLNQCQGSNREAANVACLQE